MFLSEKTANAPFLRLVLVVENQSIEINLFWYKTIKKENLGDF